MYEKQKSLRPNVKGESMLPRYHLDLHADCSVCISVIRYRGSGGRLDAGCSEVAVFRTGQGLAANVLSLKNGGWKTRFLIAFSILHIYYDTEISYCQQKKRKSGVRNRAEK